MEGLDTGHGIEAAEKFREECNLESVVKGKQLVKKEAV